MRDETLSVTFQVHRESPGSAAGESRFSVSVSRAASVLDGLLEILASQDDSVAFRYACRVGMCGSCAMVVNGREYLACQAKVEALGPEIRVAPLRNLPVIKDLLVDMAPFFERYGRILPYLVPKDPDAADLAILEPMARRGVQEQIECITCGACLSACSILATAPQFLGPAALNRAFCLVEDPRDAAGGERLRRIKSEAGLWRCHTLFNCTEVCPKEISPTLAIQRLKRRVLLDYLRGWLPGLGGSRRGDGERPGR